MRPGKVTAFVPVCRGGLLPGTVQTGNTLLGLVAVVLFKPAGGALSAITSGRPSVPIGLEIAAGNFESEVVVMVRTLLTLLIRE